MQAWLSSLSDILLDIVLSPVLWLCVLLGLAYGALFTLWRGGGFRQFLRDLAAGILGFGAGQVIASALSLPTLRVGEVHLLWGSLFAVLALLIGRRFRRLRPTSKSSPSTPEPQAPKPGTPAG